ncbi:MAG: DNA-directed RNA polymerase subunit beta [Nitrospirota bacterium]
MAKSKAGEIVSRKDFSKSPIKVEIPDLIEIQKASYDRFWQRGISPDARKDMGLQSVFTSVFPLSDYNDMAIIEFINYSTGEPKYEVSECLERGITYAVQLKIQVRLTLFEKEGKIKRARDVKEQEVYLGELPLMTENGTFVINGTERVVVSQLQRSPGCVFAHDKGKTHASGKVLYSARIIPYRGSWLDFEFDSKDILYARVDRRRKLPITVLLAAFAHEETRGKEKKYFFKVGDGRVEADGIEELLLRAFYPIEEIRIEEGLFFRRLSPEIHVGVPAPITIKDRNKEVIVKEGVRLSQATLLKLQREGVDEIPYPKTDVIGRVVLNDIVNPQTGEVLIEGNQLLTETNLASIVGSGIAQLGLLYMDTTQYSPVIRDTLATKKVLSPHDAMIEVYRRIRPGESATMEMAQTLFDGLFYNPKRYDLYPVGRLKLNKKLGINIPLSCRTLTQEDMLETVRYLVTLKGGKGEIDDIDHLGSRRVRSVGELLENQFRVGLVRMEKTIKERMSLLNLETALPHDLINAKPVIAAIKEFFGSSQLSQFMDQTNPLAEITHKRRLSALGPGGLTRDRAGFEVRDVHPSHYGRICPIETPEGPNIGLITSLATYARVNEFGFIETPYRKVENGIVSETAEFLSAIDGDRHVIAQANTAIDAKRRVVAETVSAQSGGEFVTVGPEEVQYMDVSPKQIVSVATALIPFLEHDDANRALMGSNMQRQAVPLLAAEAPIVGTGMERVVARNSGYGILAKRDGIVESVDATRIVIRADLSRKEKSSALENEAIVFDVYRLMKFQRSNQSTCIHQKPLVSVKQRIQKGDVLADGPAMENGELALGQNVFVAFMPWEGYNFEDAILLSERLVKEDRFTSIHIEEFDLEFRDTKLGKEEMTCDIPNVGEEALCNLDESGIVRVGAYVRSGDILIGKIVPKGETHLTPEEKLLRAIFGEKAGDFKDSSLYVPPGVEGTVVDVKIFARKSFEKETVTASLNSEEAARLKRDHQDELRIIEEEKFKKIRKFLIGNAIGSDVIDQESGEVLLKKKKEITKEVLDKLSDTALKGLILNDTDEQEKVAQIEEFMKEQIDVLQMNYDERIGRLRRGDELPPGVIKSVKVFIAMKRKVQVGDKMAGRHGNKGVVSRVLPEEDMPYLADGTPVDVLLNPLGVPSRMNVGQILETHLGWAAKVLGISVATPVFDGATEKDIKDMLAEAKLPSSGQTRLYDGKTGEAFRGEVTVGQMYVLKLHHLVDDKIHARSNGPYSLVTQQPLGGKAQFGGQRLGEMEVWALQSYGAASTLQEFLTVKSDDVAGRSRIYESIIKGEPFLEAGLPESFNVLIKELQSLGLDVELIKH